MDDIEYLKNNGVDVETSIELLGDIESYNETMQEFLNLYQEKLSKLKEYKDEGDLENYSIFAGVYGKRVENFPLFGFLTE